MLTYSPREALDVVLRACFNELHTAYPARVTRVHSERQTVDVQVAVMRQIPTLDYEPHEFEEVPELVDIPIQWPRAGGFVITFPIKPGDWVELICGTTNTLIWREKGGVNQRPGLVDNEFGLGGCWARPGCYPDNREHTLKSVSTQDFEIRREDGGPVIAIKPDGSVRITSGDVVVGNGPAPGAVALADLVKTEIDKAVRGHTHLAPSGGGATDQGQLVVPVGDMGAAHLKAT